jgi:hypothetical protein
MKEPWIISAIKFWIDAEQRDNFCPFHIRRLEIYNNFKLKNSTMAAIRKGICRRCRYIIGSTLNAKLPLHTCPCQWWGEDNVLFAAKKIVSDWEAKNEG